MQWPVLRREGFRYQPVLDWNDPGLRRVLVLMGPGTIGLAATQVNVFVNTVLATGEGTGAVSWLNYAFRLMYLPIGLFGVSIATATLPTVSRHAAQGDEPAARRTIADGLSLMLMLNVPATVGLIVLATPIVRVHLRARRIHRRRYRGDGDSRSVLCARPGRVLDRANCLAGLLCARSEPDAGDGERGITVLANALLNIALVRVMGYRGLALGTSIAALFNADAADGVPPPAPRRHRRRAGRRIAGAHRHRLGRDGRRGAWR